MDKIEYIVIRLNFLFRTYRRPFLIIFFNRCPFTKNEEKKFISLNTISLLFAFIFKINFIKKHLKIENMQQHKRKISQINIIVWKRGQLQRKSRSQKPLTLIRSMKYNFTHQNEGYTAILTVMKRNTARRGFEISKISRWLMNYIRNTNRVHGLSMPCTLIKILLNDDYFPKILSENLKVLIISIHCFQMSKLKNLHLQN